MILNKNDLKRYLMRDKIALGIPKNRRYPRPIIDSIWKYEIILRKYEYYLNKHQGVWEIIFHIRLLRISEKLGISIPPNVFGPGLSIAHIGTIAVNDKAIVGENCRIHEGVTIGATNGERKAAVIGDNCFIGSGAKIIGSVKIVNNVAIGAGTVVVKDFPQNTITIAGVPAKIISHNGSASNLH